MRASGVGAVLFTAFASTAGAACLKYEPIVVQLSGKLERHTYPGRPSYESVRDGDEAETGFYLVLSEPICLDARADEINGAQTSVTLVQLNLDEAGFDQLRPSLGKNVAVRGTLSAAHTGHHHAPLVLLVAKPQYPTDPFRLESAEWSEPYAGPLGVPKGAQRAVLGTDPRSGGETYYAHFPAGSRFELHWHAYAEYAVVLRGKLTHTLGTEKSVQNVGDYVVIPSKIPHGWEVDPGGDAYLLIRRDGPADQVFVKP